MECYDFEDYFRLGSNRPQTLTLYASSRAATSISSFDGDGRGNPRKGRPTSVTSTSEAGILKSTDGGNTWTAIYPYSANNIVIDPKTTPSTLYLCRDGLYKSTDGGVNWALTKLSTTAYTVVIDPTNSSILYVGGATTVDVFVTKLNPTGTDVLFSTYFGGQGRDTPANYLAGGGIALDAAGNFYVAGITTSTDFPTTPGAIQTAYNGNTDGFIVKFNAQGEVSYSTYLGGSGQELVNKLAVDPAGNVYVTGTTSSTDFPFTNLSLAAASRGGYIAKIDGSRNTVPQPLLVTEVSIAKKQLIIRGAGFKMGAKIMLNDVEQPTTNDLQNPTRILIGGKKVVNKIGLGQTVNIQVKNPDGEISNTVVLIRPEN